MQLHFRQSALAGALSLACLLPALAQQTQTGGLRWQHKQGEKSPYSFTWLLEEAIEIKGGGGGMPPQQTATEVAYGVTQEVKALEADVATIEVTIEWIRMRMSLGMMGEMAFDSKNGDDPANTIRGVRHAVGQKFTYKLSTGGKVTAVSGGAAISKAISEGLKADKAAAPPKQKGQGGDEGGMMGFGMDPAQIAEMVVTRFGSTVFSDESLESSLRLIHEILPADPAVKTWTREVAIKLPQVGTLKFKADHTNSGQTEGNARIDMKQQGEVELTKDDGPDQNPMAQMMGESKVSRKEARGSATFSTSRGRLIDSEVVMEIDSEGELPAFLKGMMGGGEGGAPPEDIKLARTTALTIRYVLEGNEPAATPPTQDKGDPKKGTERF